VRCHLGLASRCVAYACVRCAGTRARRRRAGGWCCPAGTRSASPASPRAALPSHRMPHLSYGPCLALNIAATLVACCCSLDCCPRQACRHFHTCPCGCAACAPAFGQGSCRHVLLAATAARALCCRGAMRFEGPDPALTRAQVGERERDVPHLPRATGRAGGAGGRAALVAGRVRAGARVPPHAPAHVRLAPPSPHAPRSRACPARRRRLVIICEAWRP